MTTLNDNITTSWDGLSGLAVQNAIRDLFELNVTNINENIKNVTFKNLGTGTIQYTLIHNDESETVGTFTLIEASSYSVYLDSLTIPEYVTPGQDATIKYTFHVAEGDTSKAGYIAKFKVTITNGSFSKEIIGTTPSSYSNGKRSGSLTINSDYIKEGKSTLKVEMSLTVGGAAATFIVSDSTLTIKNSNELQYVEGSLLSFTPNLLIDEGIEINKLYSTTDNLSAKFKIVDNNNKVLTSYGVSNIKLRAINNTGTQVNDWSSATNISDLAINTLSGTNGVYSLYIQAAITIGSTVLYSNVIKYQLLTTDVTSGSISRYSYVIDNFTNYSEGVIDTSGNYMEVNLYDTVKFNVCAYVPNNKSYTYKLNSVDKYTTEECSLTIDTLTDLSYSITITDKDSSIFNITDGSAELTINLVINNLGVDLTVPTDYSLNLESLGINGKTTTWTSNGYTSTFTGFDWKGNGFLNGVLVINNGALILNTYTPFTKTIGASNTSTTITGRSVSFRFSTSNENTEECLISCHEEGRDGFEIYPLKAILYKGVNSISTKFTTEESFKEVTFVWYNSSYGSASIIYINGTSLLILLEGNSVASTKGLTITANETSLNLTNITAYNRALNFSEVQALYAQHKIDDIANYAKENSIFSENISIGNNGLKVTIDSLPVGSTYLLIKAHENGLDRPWEIINNLNAYEEINGKQKETKSWRLLVGNMYLITKVASGETADAYNFFANRGTLSGQGTSSMSYPIKNFRIYFGKSITPYNTVTNSEGEEVSGTGGKTGFGDCYGSNVNDYTYNDGTDDYKDGSYGKTTVFVQGSSVADTTFTATSGSDALYVMSDTAVPANVFCLKADYAESSGIHNTGFARLADKMMDSTSSISVSDTESTGLPQNKVSESSNYYHVRQSIDGKQIYLFFADKEGNVVYHGKYNFNNEKASPEVFGFLPYNKKLKCSSWIEYNKDSSNAPKAATKLSYFDNSIVKNESDLLIQLFNLEDSTDYKKGHTVYTATDNVTYVNPTECWEFSTNQADSMEHSNTHGGVLDPITNQIGAFCFPYTSEDDIAISGYPYSNNSTYVGLNPFTEKTYNSKNVLTTDLAWINTEQAWEPRFPDNDYITEFYEDGGTPYLLRSIYKWVHKHNVYCWSSNKMTHASIFAKDLHKYFNVNYLLKYYAATKLFINADQRIKNCMMALYCDPNVESNTDPETPTGHMRAFYIFYDNDTILGVTNTGSLGNDWNSDENYGTYQGIDSNNVSFHGLWGNIEYCYQQYINGTTDDAYIIKLGQLLEEAYVAIRSAATDDNLKEYLNSSLPDAALNVDAEVKYMYPKTIATSSDNFTASYVLEMYQGNRKYHRERLLDKRTKWLDARFGGPSIKKYLISFKTEAASGTFESGNIKIYPEFDYWKFYILKSDAGAITYTSLLSKDSEGLITYNSTANSNVVRIMGLYGANKIDMSEFYGNEGNPLVSLNTAAGTYTPLPYLKEFYLGNADQSTLYCSSTSNPMELLIKGSTILAPNLLKLALCNIANPDNTAYTIDLSEFNRLLEVNLSKTKCNVTLPKGDSITKLSLYLPTLLIFENKPSLLNFTLEDTSKIIGMTITHVANSIYKKAIDICKDNYNTEGFSATITIGDGTVTDTISNETVSAIVDLAKLQITSDISIKGYALNASITADLKSIINAKFPNLLIVTSSSETFTFIYGDNDSEKSIYENKSVTITTPLPVDSDENGYKWSIVEVSGSNANTLKSYLKITDKTAYGCTVSALPYEDNTNLTCTFKLKAVYGDTEYISDEIVANYVAISTITLSAPYITNNIASNEDVTILISIGNSTKTHLFTKEKVTDGNIAFNTITNQSTLVYNYDENGLITSLTYHPYYDSTSGGVDTTISVTAFEHTGSITIYYDNVICTISEAQNTTAYKWLDKLFSGKYDLFTDGAINRSDLSKYTINSTNGILTCVVDSVTKTILYSGEEVDEYDLTALGYFKKGSDLFTIPTGIRFTNLLIPSGITSVNWTSVVSSYSNYKTITFPSSVEKVSVVLNYDTKLESLQFDLSNATKITKIYNAGVSSCSNLLTSGIFNLNLTLNGSSSPGSTNELFIYNSNISQIGYYSEEIGDGISETLNAMFNTTDSSGNKNTFSSSYAALYSLGAPTCSSLYIGHIASYKMSNSPIVWSATLANKVKGLYYTFYEGTGLSGIDISLLTFNNLQIAGDCSFYHSGLSNITIGDNLTTIGYGAFREFGTETSITNTSDAKVTTYTGTINNGNAVNLSKVTKIGNTAFYELATSHIFNFGTSSTSLGVLNTIGSGVFSLVKSNDRDNGTYHTINIYSESNNVTFTSTQYPFGHSKNNNVYLNTSNTILLNAFSTIKSDVQLYINNALQS